MAWFTWLNRRRRDRAEADRLLAAHGESAWQLVYAMCRDQALSQKERAAAYRVRRIIERRLNIAPRVDTATRYLER